MEPTRDFVDAIRGGDEAACAAIGRDSAPALIQFANAFLKSRDGVEDIVQDVFWNIWRQREEWSPSSELRTYLLTARHHPTRADHAPTRDPGGYHTALSTTAQL